MTNVRQKTYSNISELKALLQDFRQEIQILREIIATLEKRREENEEISRGKFEK